jgi:hypothetical protein
VVGAATGNEGEWLEVDLQKPSKIYGIQVILPMKMPTHTDD